MKKNQKTIKLTDTAHKAAASISNRFGLSMAAVVEIAVREMLSRDSLEIPPRDKRSAKSNSRSVLKSKS
jgi:hypothetical protein